MQWFLDAIDLSENIKRALNAVRNIRGLSALVTALAFIAICVGLAPLIWYFDVEATIESTDAAVTYILPTLPERVAASVGLVTLALTLLPTLIELFGARFAAAGITFASALVYGFSLFDAVTDWDRTEQFCEIYRRDFDQAGLLGQLLFYVFRIVWLFLATFGFELLFIVFAVTAVVLLFVGMSDNKTARSAHRDTA